MSLAYCFSLQALQRLLEIWNETSTPHLFPDLTGERDVTAISVGETTSILHRLDPVRPFLVVVAAGSDGLGATPRSALRETLRRIHLVATEATRGRVRLPSHWSEFHAGNRLAFFACPARQNDESLRWIAETSTCGSRDITFWKVTSKDTEVALEEYQPPLEFYRNAVASWEESRAKAVLHFDRTPATPAPVSFNETVDLDVVTFGAVTKHRTYSAWLSSLTESQRAFVEGASDRPIKLRGPAGSGKTLALELKALFETYRAREAGAAVSILFVTHSWAMAEQIDQALHAMDESGDIANISVYPLLVTAQDLLPSERRYSNVKILGADSLEGKREQVTRIQGILERIKTSDWLTYKEGASESIRVRVDAQRGSDHNKSLVWDLMNEFACVLSAKGILPGVNAERRYLSLARLPWMMRLVSDSDKRFVLRVYTDYVSELKEERSLSVDQIINDFLNYLGTFAWNIRRETSGYDLIFVDELHLFNEQERLALHYLTRSPTEYPRMFMALDPRQSPAEVYVGRVSVATSALQSGVADEELGDPQTLDLTCVHRFTPEILNLVKHIHRRYPALDLGPDWQLNADSLSSSMAPGAAPRLVIHQTREGERTATLAKAAELAQRAERNERVAVIVLDTLALGSYIESAESSGINASILQSRDDVYSLQYSKRRPILTAAEFSSGLQFEQVIISGLPALHEGDAYELRRQLSLLYLGISRATRRLEIHANQEDGGMPEVLESAVKARLMVAGA